MAARAVLYTELDDFKTWKIVTKEKPTAPAGKVVVRMSLVPVNPVDIIAPTLPNFLIHFGPNRIIVGHEGVGYVEEVGANVTEVKKGQRVVPVFSRRLYETGDGSWQDYVVASEDELFILPDSITDEVAAQFIINPWTVYGLLSEQNLSKGDYLLQGPQVLFWADVLARVKEITGGKLADGALDPVAGKATKVMASSVKNGGKVFTYGLLGTQDHTVTIDAFGLGRVDFLYWMLFDFVDKKTPAVIGADVSKLLKEKVLEPLSGKEFRIEEFKDAIIEAEKPGRGGKVFLRL